MAVLELLGQEAEPSSSRSLCEKLGTGGSERTIRRWLAEMAEEVPLEAKKIVPQVDLGLFIEDVFEDLREIEPSRIVGLGITIEQLNHWEKRIL